MWNCGGKLLIDDPGYRTVSAGNCVPACGLRECDFNCIFTPNLGPAFMLPMAPLPGIGPRDPTPIPGEEVEEKSGMDAPLENTPS